MLPMGAGVETMSTFDLDSGSNKNHDMYEKNTDWAAAGGYAVYYIASASNILLSISNVFFWFS